MYTLVMVMLIWGGNASTGGPIVVDGFKTKDACLTHAEKIKNSVPKVIARRPGLVTTNNNVTWEHVDCIEKTIN